MLYTCLFIPVCNSIQYTYKTSTFCPGLTQPVCQMPRNALLDADRVWTMSSLGFLCGWLDCLRCKVAVSFVWNLFLFFACVRFIFVGIIIFCSTLVRLLCRFFFAFFIVSLWRTNSTMGTKSCIARRTDPSRTPCFEVSCLILTVSLALQ